MAGQYRDILKQKYPWGNVPPARRICILEKRIEDAEKQKLIAQEKYNQEIRRLDRIQGFARNDILAAREFEEDEIARGNILIAERLLEVYGVNHVEYAARPGKAREKRERLKRILEKAEAGTLPDALSPEDARKKLKSREDAEITEIMKRLGQDMKFRNVASDEPASKE